MSDLSATEDLPAQLATGAHRRWARLAPYLTASLASAGLFLYALTKAFVWDEGFHLLAAQLIQSGKRPYLDFCFPQTPLNAYWNAAWMSLFGPYWRVTHIAATLLMSATLFMVAARVKAAYRDSRWQSAAASIAVLLMAANLTVLQFGPIAQAYAMCMFCSFASLCLLSRAGSASVFGAGLLTGIAAGSSLLSAPVPAITFLWLIIHSRWRRPLLYVVGCAIPFLPVFYLFALGPHQTWFNVIQYQALFRRVNWGNAIEHDAAVLTDWVVSGTTLLLVLLMLAGAPVLWKRRQEARLCLWIAAGLILYISTAHPTFGRYYIVGAPFFALLGAHGFAWVCERLFPNTKPAWPALSLGFILLVGAGHFVYDDRDSTDWRQYEKISAKVKSVTPPRGVVFADEQVYFLLHWTPPPGMEFSYSHKLSLPVAEEAKLHIVSEKELHQQVAAGRFSVFQTCNSDRVDEWKIENLYKQKADFDDCSVFCDLTKK